MSIFSVAVAQQPGLTVDRALGPTRVGVSGGVGQEYQLQSSTNNMGSWDFLLKLTLTNSPQSWFDASSATMPKRFYRALQSDEFPEVAQDFRLIDHLGRSRHLWYYQNDPTVQTNVRAITLIFTGNGCSKIRDMIPTITNLNARFGSQGALFWMIDSNQQDNRSNILVEATSLGISNRVPILHDAAQLVARAYGAVTTPEAVAINTMDWTIFYRGAIDDRLASNTVVTTQSYLSNALANFLAGQPVSFQRSVPAGCGIAFKPPLTNISYSADIAPLLQTKCVRCHSPGNIGSWAMTNYDIVAALGPNIRQKVTAGEMPPWHADPYYGVFTNDFSLKPDDAAKLVQWVDAGAPRGDGPDPLAGEMTTTNYPFAWPTNLGPPDVIYRIPVQAINASGVDNGGNYRTPSVVNNLIGSNVWLRAAVVRPGNVKVVHHCLVFDGNSSGGLGGLDGFFAGYVPGADPSLFPPTTGKYLTNGQVLTFQMHYVTIGTPQTDQTELGLYISPTPPIHPLQTKSAYSLLFSVTANSALYQTTAQYPGSGTLNTNILVYEMSPHMHFRGSLFKYEAIYPGGARETLLSVPNYVFRWQSTYRFTKPKYLPKGTYILCTAGWDNTYQNTDLIQAEVASGDTRFLPSRAVGFGEQSYDEMFIGYMNYAEVAGPPP